MKEIRIKKERELELEKYQSCVTSLHSLGFITNHCHIVLQIDLLKIVNKRSSSCRLVGWSFLVPSSCWISSTWHFLIGVALLYYIINKVSCCRSDDGASMLLFDTLSGTDKFSRRRVPFCRRSSIESRAPEGWGAACFCQGLQGHESKHIRNLSLHIHENDFSWT